MSYNNLTELCKEIEKRINIFDVVSDFLKFKKGKGEGSFYCGIPGHEDKHPSFIAKKGYQTYNCSSRCGTGNLYQLVEQVNGVNYTQAVLLLANFAGISEKEITLGDVMEKTQQNLRDLSKIHFEYLEKRGIKKETAEKFNLKCYGEFLSFPQFLNNKLVAYKFMSIKTKNNKFFRGINTTSKIYPNNNYSNVESIIFTAGEYDCMYLTQELEKYKNNDDDKTIYKVITSSTGEGSFPNDLIENLIKHKDTIINFRIFYDKDQAGKTGALKLAEKLNILDKPVFIYNFPDDKKNGYDVSDFFNEGYSIEDLFNLPKEKYNPVKYEKVELEQSELEKTILNFMINNNEFILDVLEIVNINDFKDYKFQTILKNIILIYNSYKYCDFEVLKHKIDEADVKESINEIVSIRALGSFEELKEYTDKLKLNSFISIAQRYTGILLKVVNQKNLLLSELQSEIAKIYENLLIESTISDKNQTMSKIIQNFSISLNNKEIALYLKTPFLALNNILQDGWRIGKLSIIAAHSSFGKTTFAIQLAEFVSQYYPVVYYAKETDKDELAEQTLSRRTSLSNYFFRKRVFPENCNIQEIIAEKTFESDNNFYFEEAFGFSTKDVINDIKKKKRKFGIKQVYIDLLQAFRIEKGYVSRREFLADFVSDLVDLASTENLSIILISHLKTPENSASLITKKPKLEDLAETSEIHRRAYTVCMIHSENRNTEDVKILIRKNRNGEADTEIDLKFERHLSRFVEKKEQNYAV